MDTRSDATSVRSSAGTPTSPKTPSTGSKKQVGFAKPRPKLIIPPPQAQPKTPSAVSARTAGTVPNNNVYYGRKASAFVFDQIHGIKDFTKSGLGAGEKSAYWMYNRLRSWSRKWFTHMFLTVVLLLYTVGGAVIFEFIEGQHEAGIRKNISEERRVYLRQLSKSSLERPYETTIDEWVGEAVNSLKEYDEKIVKYFLHNKLYITDPNPDDKNWEKKWTFTNAVVYCATIYTTMGYGHIYPQTAAGKALTIVYAIVGIPLFLIALTDFGKLFTRCIKFLWSFIRRVYYTGNCRLVRKTTHVNEIFKGAQMMYEIATFRRPSALVDPENPPPDGEPSAAVPEDTPTTPAMSNFEINDEFNLPVTIAIIILILYIFLGTLLYMPIENWTFSNAFYFVFISMSTIGFGDMVPADTVLMILSIVYLVFGLALTSMCIDVVQTKLSKTFKKASTKISETIGIDIEEEEEEEEGEASGDAGSPKVGEAPGSLGSETPGSERDSKSNF